MIDVVGYVAGVLLATAVFALCGVLGLLTSVKKQSKENLTGSEVLETIQDAKQVFPVGSAHGWQLYCQCQAQRVWQRNLQQSTDSQVIYGCFTRLKASSQAILNTLQDLDKYAEWRPELLTVKHVLPPGDPDSGATTIPTVKPLGLQPVQYDLVVMETEWPSGTYLDWLLCYLQGEEGAGSDKKTIHVARYWHREDNGCCWMLELNEDTRDWSFYLAQPVQELDQCILSVVYHPGDDKQLMSPQEDVAGKVSSLDNYFQNRKVQCSPLLAVSLPNADGDGDQPGVLGVGADINDSDSPTKSKNILRDFAKFVTEASGGKSRPALLRRFKSVIESKKEWYERERERRKQEANEVQLKAASSILDNCADSDSDSDGLQQGASTEAGVRLVPKAVRRRLKLENLRRTKSLDLEGTKNDGTNPLLGYHPLVLDAEGKTLQAECEKLANETTAKILAEKMKVASIDISRPYDEQAETTGGWIFCGVEKDVVIMRKTQDDTSTLHSYMGKGLLPVSQRTVYDAVRNPRTRFTYDESLKKIDIICHLGTGMKILYMYHEVSQLFKKEARDFCLLQTETVDGDRYIVTLSSVHWPACPPIEGITRAKFLASGWIIEPAVRNKKPYSMVTYIAQLDLGGTRANGSNIIEELAIKQPNAITFLRQYLHPHRTAPAVPLATSPGSRSSSRETTPVKVIGDTLASVAAALSPSNSSKTAAVPAAATCTTTTKLRVEGVSLEAGEGIPHASTPDNLVV